MSISISRQNERWAQLNAYQPPPASQSGQNGQWDPSVGTDTSAGSTGTAPSAGGTSGALSDGVSFALMAFGDWRSKAAASTQSTGQDSTTSDASASSSASTGQSGITQDGTTSVSELVTDLQSLLSALTGTSSAGSTATSDTTATSANTGTAAATGLSSTVLQDLQTVSSDLNSIASTSGTTPPGGAGGPPPGPLPWSNDISNTGTTTGSGTGITGGWNSHYNDAFQQQFALSAYNASTMSGLDNSTTSSLTSITA